MVERAFKQTGHFGNSVVFCTFHHTALCGRKSLTRRKTPPILDLA
jgi:hypothetical protein